MVGRLLTLLSLLGNGRCGVPDDATGLLRGEGSNRGDKKKEKTGPKGRAATYFLLSSCAAATFRSNSCLLLRTETTLRSSCNVQEATEPGVYLVFPVGGPFACHFAVFAPSALPRQEPGCYYCTGRETTDTRG